MSEEKDYLYQAPDIFVTMDNNAKPFTVLVFDRECKAVVYKNDDNGWGDETTTKMMEIDYVKIFIGKDCCVDDDKEIVNTTSKKNYLGNSILFEIREQEYIFVGKTIYYFNTKPNKDKIVKFISNMGPNGVPYPFAYGEKNVYFMLDHKFLSYAIINEKRILNKDETYDAYKFLYDWNTKLIGFDVGCWCEGEDYNGPEELIYGVDFFNYGEIYSRFGEEYTANDEIKKRIK